MFTAQFDRFVAPARKHPQIWRLLVGLLVIVAVYLVWIAAIFGGIWLFGGAKNLVYWGSAIAATDTPIAMFLLFASFVGAALGPMIAARILHKRSAGSLFGIRVKVVRDFGQSAVLVLFINAILILFWSVWFTPIKNMNFGLWLSLLPFAALGILVQTAAEELVFRGYLQQQLAARFKSPLIWMLLPSALFAMLHYAPDVSGANTWLIVGATGMFALIAADLTRITGSIGAAWGFHFANNVWAISLVSVQGNLSGLAMYKTPFSASDTTILPIIVIGDLGAMIVGWGLLRRLLQR